MKTGYIVILPVKTNFCRSKCSTLSLTFLKLKTPTILTLNAHFNPRNSIVLQLNIYCEYVWCKSRTANALSIVFTVRYFFNYNPLDLVHFLSISRDILNIGFTIVTLHNKYVPSQLLQCDNFLEIITMHMVDGGHNLPNSAQIGGDFFFVT